MHGRFDLEIAGARRDIGQPASNLKDGHHVLPYGGDEVEAEAIVEFDRVANRWMVSLLWGAAGRMSGDRVGAEPPAAVRSIKRASTGSLQWRGADGAAPVSDG